jgi:hypothetical protein
VGTNEAATARAAPLRDAIEQAAGMARSCNRRIRWQAAGYWRRALRATGAIGWTHIDCCRMR